MTWILISTLKILTCHAWKLLVEIGPTFNLAAHNLGLSLTKSKMAEPTEEELIHSIKEALRHKKSAFQRRIGNSHKLRDLDITFNRLNQISELAVKGNFGGIRERPKHKLGELYPMLERCMIRAKSAIDRRLSPRMSKLHPWMVVFDLPMARGVWKSRKPESGIGTGMGTGTGTGTGNSNGTGTAM